MGSAAIANSHPSIDSEGFAGRLRICKIEYHIHTPFWKTLARVSRMMGSIANYSIIERKIQWRVVTARMNESLDIPAQS